VARRGDDHTCLDAYVQGLGVDATMTSPSAAHGAGEIIVAARRPGFTRAHCVFEASKTTTKAGAPQLRPCAVLSEEVVNNPMTS
jgi:hypothetical protein